MGNKAKVGIDEVGRGCIAGPVIVVAAFVPMYFKYPKNLPKLKDSKLMTRLQREAWYKWVQEEGIKKGIIIAVSSASPVIIDKINISASANLAAWRALNKILKRKRGVKTNIILDGGLFIKSRKFQENFSLKNSCAISLQPFSFSLEIKTIIGADKKFKEVKLASVMAKVTRDTYMKRMAEKYPEFGFEHHKGYGTKTHLKVIKKSGPIEGFHRKTFLLKII